MVKNLIHVVLFAVIILLGYLVVESVAKPMRFKKEQEKRYAITIQKLKDIRTVQNAYKDVYGRFTGSFDTLINFAKYDSLRLIYQKGQIPEELLGQITEREAIAKGLIIRDTSYVKVIDSLFVDNFPIDSLRYIPFSGGKQFSLAQSEIVTGSKLKVKVFEAKAPSKYVLSGLDMQEIVNFNDTWEYKGLKVGSLTEANNGAGNWE